jgi:hypothetical protein
LLNAQICVRLLERLLTLRIVKGRHQVALAAMNMEAAGCADAMDDAGENDEDDE